MRSFVVLAAVAALFAASSGKALARQQPMGSVATSDALVTGGLEVSGDRARLLTNASVTAYDHTAAIDLARGGQVLVCATSQFHLLHSGAGASLVFGLDRGAIEIHTPSQAQDVILTPDLRFTFATQGQLDLRLRVTPDGDTCVDNAGASAPVIVLNDAFSSDSYRLVSGQHVLFEHGNLQEVVDRETSSCGCPAPAPPRPAAVAAAEPGTPAATAAQHPFPAAASQGLAPVQPAAANSVPSSEASTQVSTTLAFGAKQPGRPSPPPIAPPPPPAPAVVVSTQPPASPPGAHDLAHLIGGFFHKLFHHRH